MKFLLSCVVVGSLAVSSASPTAVGATVGTTITKLPAQRMQPMKMPDMIAKRTLGSVKGSTGCRSNGAYYFIGEPGGYPNGGGGGLNYAGGGRADPSGQTGFAGVAAGVENAACDFASAIVGGESNTVGGDGISLASVIAGGDSNEIAASYAFIGGGLSNLVGGNTASASAIAGGALNSMNLSTSFIGAGTQNSIINNNSPDRFYADFVGAGMSNAVSGGYAGIVTGLSNSVNASYSLVGSGQSNTINAPDAFIGSGATNTIGANALDSAIAGGAINSASGGYAFVGGGQYNSIGASGSAVGEFSVISGGYDNLIPSAGSGNYAAIGGGYQNKILSEYATIAGGLGNANSGEYAAIGGGFNNAASGIQAAVAGGYGNVASGKNAAIPGGTTNVASGSNSFAAGTKSTAGFTGDFIWSDYISGSGGVSATGADQFVARATGGFYLYSSASLAGVALAPGSGAWSTLSDRNVKTGIADIDDERILAKLAAMPVSEWSYKAQGMSVRHLGPMAQDFRAAFGLGEDDRHISTVDEEGVALAAIKALQRQAAAKDRQLAEMRRTAEASVKKLADLEAKYARLEQRLDALAATGHPGD